MADAFTSELAFEDALVEVLERDYGWRNGGAWSHAPQSTTSEIRKIDPISCLL